MRIRDVVTRSSHFHTIVDVPIVAGGATLRGAFEELQRHKASFILFVDEDDGHHFITALDLIEAAADGSLEAQVADLACADDAPLVAVISMDQPETVIAEAFAGRRAAIPAIVLDGPRIVGVWTPREDDNARLFTPAPIYYCKRNNHPNRPPRPAQCRYRGCGSGFA